MNRILDGITALLLCAFLAMGNAGSLRWPTQDGLACAVVGLLLATVLLCASFLAKNPQVTTVVAVVSALMCALAPGTACFLPVAAYLGMMQALWPVRVLWVLAWLWAVTQGIQPLLSVESLAFCLLMSAFAVRTVRTEALLRGLQSARDDVSERLLSLRAERADTEAVGTGAAADEPAAEGVPSALEAPDAGGMASVPDYVIRQGISQLTERELSIARLIAEGCTNRQIAARLFLSEGTVRNHVSNILQKTCAENRTQLALLFRI